MGIENNFVFMQDNDPKHSACNTRMWIAYNTSAHLKTHQQSPDIITDMNICGIIWDDRKRRISSKTDLKHALINEWNNTTDKIASNLVNSIPRRLAAIIKSKLLIYRY